MTVMQQILAFRGGGGVCVPEKTETAVRDVKTLWEISG